jgi:hypothetical protein
MDLLGEQANQTTQSHLEDRYEGGRDARGQYHGFGTYRFGAGRWFGDKYEGDWNRGTKHGRARYSYANGDYFQGSFVNNNKEGPFIFQFANGDLIAVPTCNSDHVPGDVHVIFADGIAVSVPWKISGVTTQQDARLTRSEALRRRHDLRKFDPHSDRKTQYTLPIFECSVFHVSMDIC